MNKVVKTATLIAFTAMFAVFSVKPAAAIDFSKALDKAANSKATKDAVKSVTNATVKMVDKVITPKGPTREIQITGIPSEYQGHYAQIMASLPEDPMDVCMPSYLTSAATSAGEGAISVLDTVNAGEVKTSTPCDDKKRLVVLILTKTKDEKTTDGGGFIYAKDASGDACKSKATMPVYKLSDKQTFRFSDFISNESCKKIADAVKGKK